MKPKEIREIPNALAPELCEMIINESRPRLTPAKVGRGRARAVHPSRVALNYKYRVDTAWSLELRTQVAELLQVDDLDLVEPVEVVCYEPGGFYYRHVDDAAGDRPYSFLICLSDQYEGGELFFDQLGALYTHIPVGMGLLWKNTRFMTHECRPVKSGYKWIACVWVNVRNAQERADSHQDPLGEPQDLRKSPIIIPGVND